MLLSNSVPSSKHPPTNWICSDLMCMYVCAFVIRQCDKMLTSPRASLPKPPPDSLSLSASPSLFVSASAGFQETDWRQTEAPPSSPLILLPLLSVSLSMIHVCELTFRFVAWFHKTENVNEWVYDWEESFNHIKGNNHNKHKNKSFFHCLGTDFLRMFTNFCTR